MLQLENIINGHHYLTSKGRRKGQETAIFLHSIRISSPYFEKMKKHTPKKTQNNKKNKKEYQEKKT